MAVVTPDSDVILLKMPLEINEENQLTFANLKAQTDYFTAIKDKLVLDDNDYSYQRKDGIIRAAGNYDSLYTYNYVMYKNTHYNNKWFYAYITDMEYVNDSVTAISIKTDVWQTWQFDLTFKPTFVEREHVNSDNIGEHTVPENLECGEYLIDSNTQIDLGTSTMVVFMVTEPPYDGAPVTYITHSIGNAFNGLIAFATRFGDASSVIDMYNDSSETTADAIYNIYIVPTECVNTNSFSTWTSSGHTADIFQVETNTQTLTATTISQSSTFQGYTPVNKKLMVYPYRYFHITNNAGADIEFKWEDMPQSAGVPYADILVEGIASCGAQAKLTLKEYKNYNSTASGNNQLLTYGVPAGKMPCCAWTTDYYTNWLTQNGVNIGVTTAIAAAGIGLGVLSGGTSLVAAGAILGGASKIGSEISEISKAAKTPDQAKGDIATGDLLFSNQECAFNFYSMSIRPEYARIIDGYFSAYGYKVNRIKTPNITGRLNWNYVKTINCYIRADIPQNDLSEIESMFNKGITLWHNPLTFMDYSQANTIVA